LSFPLILPIEGFIGVPPPPFRPRPTSTCLLLSFLRRGFSTVRLDRSSFFWRKFSHFLQAFPLVRVGACRRRLFLFSFPLFLGVVDTRCCLAGRSSPLSAFHCVGLEFSSFLLSFCFLCFREAGPGFLTRDIFSSFFYF